VGFDRVAVAFSLLADLAHARGGHFDHGLDRASQCRVRPVHDREVIVEARLQRGAEERCSQLALLASQDATGGDGVGDAQRSDLERGLHVQLACAEGQDETPGLPSVVHLAPSRRGVLLARACRRALAEDDYDPIAESRTY
jgi:hypothetical protein